MNNIFVTCYKPFQPETFVLHKRTGGVYNEAVISPAPKIYGKPERNAYGNHPGAAAFQAAGRLFPYL